MKPLFINQEGIINHGSLKGFKGIVVAFDSEIDLATIKLDDQTFVHLSSEMIDQKENRVNSEFCEKCNHTGFIVDKEGYLIPCDCVPDKFLNIDLNHSSHKYDYRNVQEIEDGNFYHGTKEVFEFSSKEKELLKRLFEATVKLDTHYCTILNRQDFNEGMSGEEYEEINDLLIEVGKFLESKN